MLRMIKLDEVMKCTKTRGFFFRKMHWKHEASLSQASEAVIDDAVVTFDKKRNYPEKIPWTL